MGGIEWKQLFWISSQRTGFTFCPCAPHRFILQTKIYFDVAARILIYQNLPVQFMKFIICPFCRVVGNVCRNALVGLIVSYDVFVVIALP